MDLANGIGHGQSVAIIGGGPSLKGFDFSRIPKHHKIIAINAAFKYAPQADFVFSEDLRFIERFGSELLMAKPKVVWHCLRGINPERGVKACRNIIIIKEVRDDKYRSRDLTSLSYSSNSAVGAINLCDILAFDHIYLLGIDCRSDGLFMQNFHNEYPEDWLSTSMNASSWKSDLENWVAPNCRIPITNVINPAYESTVECWPKITLEEFLR